MKNRLTRRLFSSMKQFLITFLFGVLALSTESYAVGQSAVITLVFPSGARSLAMGEVGTALADDEQVLYYNPAGLGMSNYRFRGGSYTNSYEQLLPAFHIRDLWHVHLAGCYQPPASVWGGFAADLNFINFGINQMTDEQGREIARYRSFEGVGAIGWGFNLVDAGIKNHFWGIGLKLLYSALAPGYGTGTEGIASSFAADVGYIWRFLPFMRFGLTFANMGPSVYYIDRSEADPIPFTINLALAYQDEFFIGNFKLLKLSSEIRADREVVKTYPDRQPDPFWKAIYTDLVNDPDMTTGEEFEETNWHLGFESTFANTFSVRNGFLFDMAGKRFETHFGIGVRIYDHFQWDFSTIYSPEGYLKGFYGLPEGSNGSRHGQYHLTFTFLRMGNWSPHDGTWFLKQ
jgi:hypothetical protein